MWECVTVEILKGIAVKSLYFQGFLGGQISNRKKMKKSLQKLLTYMSTFVIIYLVAKQETLTQQR